MLYARSLAALKNVSRFRERILNKGNKQDFASNDYLGLAEQKSQLKRAYNRVKEYPVFAPKASQLVNGYHPIHQAFEKRLCKLNGFESAMVVGSGFLANMAMIEALPRKGDLLLMDKEYHASGIVASKLTDATVLFFPHNDYDAAARLLKNREYKNAFIAIEGVYSMSGDIAPKAFFDLAEETGAMLIVDEAHSSGVIGPNLLGIFDHYGIEPKPNHIKMGTLGKAYGSYGAYILAHPEVISFLENRAKSVIYATAPSVFDIALADENLKYIAKNRKALRKRFKKALELAKEITGMETASLILPVPVESAEAALEKKEALLAKGYEIGAIRPPTVQNPILRVILRTHDLKALKKALTAVTKVV
jgi:8-amino-7-oxononanoate synthase